MPIPKNYDPKTVEPRLEQRWQVQGIYHFDPQGQGPVYSIDTPPPTVSGHLHLGHVYSYSHADFIARFWRMRGRRIFYPMGYDDNGLPTERLVEKKLGITAQQVGRQAFINKCLEAGASAEQDYQALWQRLGLSIDWRYSYRTIDERSRRTSQLSFIELYHKGCVYRREAPAIWCPECRTAIAQAELNDLERSSEYVTLAFPFVDEISTPGAFQESTSPGVEEGALRIATTRPELLPACVAVFVHPDDPRYQGIIGRRVRTPLFGQSVPVLVDPAAEMEKGTGAVMCCTFGDTTDVAWWYTHHLPYIEALDRQGRLTAAAGEYAGLPAGEARRKIASALEARGEVLERQPTQQSIRVHERCDTPVEYIQIPQWFVRVLDFKDELLQAGETVQWHPEYMQARYQAWVENLSWDWCLSRQRYYGVPFPVWYCTECGEIALADPDQLPVDPAETWPARPCACGSTTFAPEEDVMDTWATSSLSPQIVGQRLDNPALYAQVFPFSLRPQAHEIIRTWAFYTIVKSHFHFDSLPWKDAFISGWGIAGEGMGKISKSRGGGPMPPMEMIQRYSADAVRYWAGSTSTGKDAVISEEKIQMGARLVTKLWNVARFSERFLTSLPDLEKPPHAAFTLADRWILARLQRLVRRVTALFESYDYAAAKSESEAFFWRELADNYLEMSKQRLYDEAHPQREGARYTLAAVLLTLLKLFAPLLPYVTEEIYLGLFAGVRPSRLGNLPATQVILPGLTESSGDGVEDDDALLSIHTSAWPAADASLEDEDAERAGEALVEIATAVRRYKSEHSLALSTGLKRLEIHASDSALAQALEQAAADLGSITRAKTIVVVNQIGSDLVVLSGPEALQVAVSLD